MATAELSKDGRLTHAGMVHAIRKGGSVMIGPATRTNQPITRVEDLPAPEEVAALDTAELERLHEEAVAASLAAEERAARIQEQLKAAKAPATV